MVRNRSLLVALALTGAAAARVEAIDAGFCDDPVWCDPLRAERVATGPDLLARPVMPNPLLLSHQRVGVAVTGVLGTGIDSSGALFVAPLDGNGLPAGEEVACIGGTSLGAVTRRVGNGSMVHAVRIDDPALNHKPGAVLVATRASTPGSSTSPVGVWFDGSYWWIYNESTAPMSVGETFFYAEGTRLGGRAVRSASNDYQGVGVYLDDPRLNGNPAAVVVAQHGFGGAYNNSALGVFYDQTRAQWVVYNENGSGFGLGEAVHYITVP